MTFIRYFMVIFLYYLSSAFLVIKPTTSIRCIDCILDVRTNNDLLVE